MTMHTYSSAADLSPTSSDASSPASAAEGLSGLVKRAYQQPEVETIGSVPQITGGSDIFGDNRG